MKTHLKIAIYSGTIPSSPFIEHYIKAIAEHHTVLLFGTKKKQVTYASERIQIIDTPTQKWPNVLITLLRTFKLLLKHPKHVGMAYREALNYKSIYQKWMCFSRFIPVILYRPDIFHVQWAVQLHRWMFLKQVYDCKIVLSLLGTHINISPKLQLNLKHNYERYFPEVDAFHAVSKALAHEAELYGASPHKLHLIYSIVSKSAINQFKLPDKDPKPHLNILSVGRHHWVKGYTYALHAVKLLKDQGYPVIYTIIAPNNPQEELVYLVNDLGLKDFVFFKPAIPQEDLFGVMHEYDLLLQSSISEGIANVVLEAMAIGLPVVSTNCGGMAEVVIPQQTGWLAPMRSPEGIYNSIMDYTNTPISTKHQILTRAHDFIRENFNSTRIGQQFSLLYEQLK